MSFSPSDDCSPLSLLSVDGDMCRLTGHFGDPTWLGDGGVGGNGGIGEDDGILDLGYLIDGRAGVGSGGREDLGGIGGGPVSSSIGRT
jgi:hypothetical protein